MARSLRLTVPFIVIALLVALAPRANAAVTTSWYALYQRIYPSTLVDSDILTNDEMSFTSSYSYMHTRTPGWPATVSVQTDRPTTELSPLPAVTPVIDPATGDATYTWSGSDIYLNATLNETGAVLHRPGLTATRAMSGGRVLAPHETTPRSFTFDVHVVEAITSMQLDVYLGSPIGAAVTTSGISCSGASLDATIAGWFHWTGLNGAAGADISVGCALTLANTGDTEARFMPRIDLSAVRSSSTSVAGSSATVDDPDLGHVSYSVTPPQDVAPTVDLDAHVSTSIIMTGENTAVVSTPWAGRLVQLLSAGQDDDSAPDVVRPFELGWQFGVTSPWDSSIHVTTTLDTEGWVAIPDVTPVTSDGATTYNWDHQTSALLSSMGFVDRTRMSRSSSLGVAVTRASAQGVRVAAGATQRRNYTITLVATTTTTADITIFFNSGIAGSPNPILVSDASCTDPSSTASGPTFIWTGLALAAGTSVQLNCAATITNTSAGPAVYMPPVMATRSTQATELIGGADVRAFGVTSDPLGSVTFLTSAPMGALIGPVTFVDAVERQVFLYPVNRALEPTTITYLGPATTTLGSGTAISAKLSATTFGAPLPGKTLRFTVAGVSYDATTSSDGIATVTVPGTLSLGQHLMTIAFAEDRYFLASSQGATLTVTPSGTSPRGKVTGGVTTENGAKASFVVITDGTTIDGVLELRFAGHLRVTSWSSLVISDDGLTATAIGEATTGEHVELQITDNGEPGRSDRLVVLVDGLSVTGDGSVVHGNLQIHKE